jgi:hypothetical protein
MTQLLIRLGSAEYIDIDGATLAANWRDIPPFSHLSILQQELDHQDLRKSKYFQL